MTSKTAKLAADTIIAEAQAPAAPAACQPRSITLIGTTINTMQQAAVLIRQGYYPNPEMPIEFFGHMGTMQIHLIPGTPAQEFVNAASVSTAEAAEIEQAQFRKAVEAEAKRQIKESADAALAAKKAALLADQKRQLAALESEIAAAVK